jgi:flagellar export protein FliJ
MPARDPLEALLRVRRLGVDEARRALADSLRAEEQAAAALTAVDAEIRQETEAACRLDADDTVVEQFARWLRRAHDRQREARAGRDAAELVTAQARGVLSAARAAVRATEAMLERQAAIRAAAAARTEQAVLDEAGQQAHRRRGATAPQDGVKSADRR